jgi:hypothetical protein
MELSTARSRCVCVQHHEGYDGNESHEAYEDDEGLLPLESSLHLVS